MRVRLQNDDSGQTFSDQLLAIGNGKLPVDSISGRIQLPAEFCNLVTSKNELVEKVFPKILNNYKNNKWLSERTILAPKNKDVHEINNIVLTKIRDQAVLYKSVDTVLEPNEAVNYPSEFLNSVDLSGFPPHVLQLKIGVPIILLRNINPPKLCNGTRLAVEKTMENIIEATILTGPFEGEAVLIPRIPMIPTDLPFQFKRLQFPIRLAFAINKAQGQSLEKCGIDLIVFPMDNCTLLVRGSVNLTIYLYAATTGQRRMWYIRKFYAVNLYCIYLSISIKTSCVYTCLFVCKKSVCI